MAYIITNAGEKRILSGGLGMAGAEIGSITASLITSALTFTATMTLTSVTHLTAGRAGGDNSKCSAVLSGSAWSDVPFLQAGYMTVSATGVGLRFQFTAAPNASAIGYALWDDSNLYVVETFTDGPYYLSNAGDTVTVTPYIKLGSGTFN